MELVPPDGSTCLAKEKEQKGESGLRKGDGRKEAAGEQCDGGDGRHEARLKENQVEYKGGKENCPTCAFVLG